MQTIFFKHQRPHARVILILAVLLALVANAFPSTGYAEGEWALINGTVTVINNEPGDQVRPHISGDRVTYTSVISGNSYVSYYDFQTGTTASIPNGNSLDFQPDINSTKIVYTLVTTGTFAINFFDVGTMSTSITVDPQPNSQREKPSIGDQTLAWVDFGLSENPYISDIVVYNLVTGVKTRLTDDEFYDTDPSVSPDGSFIVWTKCQFTSSGCHVWQASYNGTGWDVVPVPGSGEQTNPATDGQYIVYSNYLNYATTESNIIWQIRGGSEEHEIVLPGIQRNPAIDGGVVVFESTEDTSRTSPEDILLYNLNAGEGYQVSTAAERDVMPDIAFAPDGLIRVVWTQDSATTNADIYASTFRLPETGSNQPPVIDQITAPLVPTMVNSTVLVTANFSDPDFTDTHTALWDWGDDGAESDSGSTAIGVGTVSGSHTYANPGVYVVTLTVTDNHAAADTEVFQYVVVFDPVGGFVTGSGWIDSPAAAYTLDPALIGKAHFGFVSRYQKGASLPSGSTEFQFKAGDLSFRSTTYDWLVIAGAKAQFKGTGTVNGSGDYGFLLIVTDGQVVGGGDMDKFRIKIWDRVTDAVIYDNQPGDDAVDPSTSIGGGSIVIHK